MNKIHRLSGLNKEFFPLKINFPFHYVPHPWAVQASEDLQDYLTQSKEMQSYFDTIKNNEGKMFGVLVVQQSDGKIGYLAAFSGKLEQSNLHDFFVPPVFNILNPSYQLKDEMKAIEAKTNELEQIKSNVSLNEEKEQVKNQKSAVQNLIAFQKEKLKMSKKRRDDLRKTLKPNQIHHVAVLDELNEESAIEHIEFKKFKREKEREIEGLENKYQALFEEERKIRQERSELSNQFQKRIFQQFKFMNARNEFSDLYHLFNEKLGVNPPSGAGECAAPKLFQYAFLNHLKPLTFAEFWWGNSPKSEIRHHRVYYPSCQGKCRPILTHMLQGLEVEADPLLVKLRQKSKEVKELEIIYEDEFLVVINKPNGFLSVPGKEYTDSILERLISKYPNATGPILLHRLDMATSGLLLAAKEKHIHQLLQQQFIERKIKKRYDAVLDGIIEIKEGTVCLPIRVDLNSRPRQIVDFEHGKEAITDYKVMNEKEEKTLIHLFPKTGRTHQLRVHTSHKLGLNSPIVGDVLYGKEADRLYLHAAFLSFYHPKMKKWMEFSSDSHFTL